MIRLFVDGVFESGQEVVLPIKQAHYVQHVMRLKESDQLELINGKQGVWLGEVHLEKKQVFLTLQKQLLKQKALPSLILCPALIKKEAMELVLQKATELGATEIHPILADRSVVQTLNLDRSEMILREACEQCERMDKPVLHAPDTLENVLTQLKGKADLVWLSERGKSAGKRGSLPPALFVGPEGGWTSKEQETFRQLRATEWHFGQTILRAETASIVALALCLKEN